MSDALPALHATRPIPLTLSPAEFGVAVALVGLGIAAMTQNLAMANQYRQILSSDDIEALAMSAFQNMTAALEVVSPIDGSGAKP